MTPEEQQLISLYAGEALRVSVPLILTFAGYSAQVNFFIPLAKLMMKWQEALF